MPEVLERLGYDDERLIREYLKPLLGAQESRLFSHIRLRALDLAFKLKGSYAPVRQEQHVTHTLTTAEIESACNIAEQISKMRVID